MIIRFKDFLNEKMGSKFFSNPIPSSGLLNDISKSFYNAAGSDIDEFIDSLPLQHNIDKDLIVPTQFINEDKFQKIKDFKGLKQYPFFIKFENRYYIFDGHHRTAYNILNNQPISAHVFDNQ